MSKPKILIVDDSQLNREILSCMLEDKYDICEAENGKQAVEILERCHKDFKLVLLDLIMPVMDYEGKAMAGYAACYLYFIRDFRR